MSGKTKVITCEDMPHLQDLFSFHSALTLKEFMPNTDLHRSFKRKAEIMSAIIQQYVSVCPKALKQSYQNIIYLSDVISGLRVEFKDANI